MAFDRGEPPVHWIVQVDPRGETSLRQAVAHQRTWRAVTLRAQVPLQACELGGEDECAGRAGVPFRALFRLHRVVCHRASQRQAQCLQPHRHRTAGRHRQPRGTRGLAAVSMELNATSACGRFVSPLLPLSLRHRHDSHACAPSHKQHNPSQPQSSL